VFFILLLFIVSYTIGDYGYNSLEIQEYRQLIAAPQRLKQSATNENPFLSHNYLSGTNVIEIFYIPNNELLNNRGMLIIFY